MGDSRQDISISKIKRLGRNIRASLRSGETIGNDNLITLQQYRILHQESLRQVFSFLVENAPKVNKGSTVVYRLKRIDTILSKIQRQPTMDLSKMQDIAGCRVIMYSIANIRELEKIIKSDNELDVLKVDDYISKPAPSGYRSLHIIVKPNDCKYPVEIQLRTKAIHDWATLVEITDLIFNTKVKEGEDHPQLYRFHQILAKSRKDMEPHETIELIHIESQLKIVNQIFQIFSRNTRLLLERWTLALGQKSKDFILMELDDELMPTFTFCSTFRIAEAEYFTRFSASEPEMVLIHINNPTFDKINLAYSNYVLSSHPTIKIYLDLLVEHILTSKRLGFAREYTKRKNYFYRLVIEMNRVISNEIDILTDHLEQKQYTSDTVSKDWSVDLSNRMNELRTVQNNFKVMDAKLNLSYLRSFKRKLRRFMGRK